MATPNTNSASAGADLDALFAQIGVLRDDLAKLAHSVRASATQRGQSVAEDARETMHEAAGFIQRKGHEADLRLETAVAANPYIALGLAAGLGALLGALGRRGA